MFTKGKVAISIDSVNSPKLDEELRAIAPELGWALELDGDGKPAVFRYEYPEGAGYDPAAIISIVNAHSVSLNEDNDQVAAERAAQRTVTQRDKLQEVLEGWDALVAEVVALRDGRIK